MLTSSDDPKIKICIRTEKYIRDSLPCIGIITIKSKGVRIDSDLLRDLCQNQPNSCWFYLEVTQAQSNTSSIAYTTNDSPIRITLESLIQGPIANFPIKFIANISDINPIKIHFSDHDGYQIVKTALMSNNSTADDYQDMFTNLLKDSQNTQKLTYEKEDFLPN